MLPELQPLEGDDEPLGDAIPSIALDDEGASLDDDAFELELEHRFDEHGGDLADAELPAGDFGDPSAEIAVRDDAHAPEEELDDARFEVSLEALPLADAAGDGGEEGVIELPMDLGAPPPLDDDDDDERPEPPPRPRSTQLVKLDGEGVVAVAVLGRRLATLAAEVVVRSLDDPRRIEARLDAPSPRCVAVAFEGPRQPLVATAAGPIHHRDRDGVWRIRDHSPPDVVAMAREGESLWALCRSGAIARVFPPEPHASRVKNLLLATDPDGGLVALRRGAPPRLRLRSTGGTWTSREPPVGANVTRIALCRNVIAVFDGTSRRCWVGRWAQGAWVEVEAPGCVDAALSARAEGRVCLLVACAQGREVTLLRVECDAPTEAPRVVATIAREGGSAPPSVSLTGVGEGAALCVVLVDGRAYVVMSP